MMNTAFPGAPIDYNILAELRSLRQVEQYLRKLALPGSPPSAEPTPADAAAATPLRIHELALARLPAPDRQEPSAGGQWLIVDDAAGQLGH